MSAYAEVRCDVKDQDTLIEALELMGFARQDLLIGRRQLEGWHGDRRSQVGDVTIPRRLGHASNDVGFECNADGTWTMHLSRHDQSAGFSAGRRGGFEGEFRRSYGEAAIKRRLKDKGYKWTEKTVDGKKVIKATRWKK